ncbi:MAG: hypothetical protein LBU91_02660 [Bacteroidales bacterium]|jgi:hypothetical protein|nr:hypothetical protein [Bacteroidales bacterium]
MKSNKFLAIAGAVLAIAATFASCEPDEDGGTGTKRYETVPYVPTTPNPANVARAASEMAVPETAQMVYSAYDAENFYYVFLLGHVNYVPIAYKDAVMYDGKTAMTISYSRENATEEAIMESTTTAVENTVSNTSTVSVGVEATFLGFGANVSTEFSWENSETRSTANTYETSLSKINGETLSMSATVGENNEPEGKYRYSLFATTDVFYVLVLNKSDRTQLQSYTTVFARPETYAWGIDYEPDPAGNFGKTAAGDLLEIPELNYNTLPEPTEELISDFFATSFTQTITQNHSMGFSNSTPWEEKSYLENFTADLNIERLKAEGYTSVTITAEADFDVEGGLMSGWESVFVGIRTTSTPIVWWGNVDRGLSYDDYGWKHFTFPLVNHLMLDDYTNEFTIQWRTVFVKTLGTRKVTVTAQK